MKVLVTGVKGQLGSAVLQRLKSLPVECKGADIADFDLTDGKKTTDYIKLYKPDAVIHCAAYTDVNRAETDKETCYNVNVNGTKHIAAACEQIGAKLMYISTDYVFDGKNDEPYETDAKPNPLSYYGETKYLGELALKGLNRAFIVRTSWVFGENGHNFIETMLKLGKQGKALTVVNDQIGAPTYTKDLARLLCEMIQTGKYGIYHAANEGYCSWYEYAKHIFKCSGLKADIAAVTTEEYPSPAKRPKNSRLSKRSLDEAGFERLPAWEDAVNRYILNKNKVLQEE